MDGLVSVSVASMLGAAPPRSTDAAARLEDTAVRLALEASRAGCKTSMVCSMVTLQRSGPQRHGQALARPSEIYEIFEVLGELINGHTST